VTGLEHVVVAALPILADLSGNRATREQAERDLNALATTNGLRIRLIEHKEAFDDSVHYDVIVRGPGYPTVSLSVASEPGLPWPLRGVPAAREHDLVEVNGEVTRVAEAVACLDGMFEDVRLMRGIVDSSLVGRAFEEFGLEVTAEEVQEATDAYRRARRLYTAEATAAWMRDRGFTPALLATLVEQYAAVGKVRRHAVGGHAQRWFTQHSAEMEVVVAAWVAGGTESRLRADALSTVAAAWRDGRPGGLDQWRIADLPAGFAALRAAAVGDVVAVEHGDTPAVAILVDRQPAVADPQTMAAVERHLFDAWLAERRAAARITWFWGGRRQTERVDADR
jgi:putative peptide maturation system protein